MLSKYTIASTKTRILHATFDPVCIRAINLNRKSMHDTRKDENNSKDLHFFIILDVFRCRKSVLNSLPKYKTLPMYSKSFLEAPLPLFRNLEN